jgi:LCP family protein required for cell wall assembly
MFTYRNKVQPIPPIAPKEIRIGKKSRGLKIVKWIFLAILVIVIGLGIWVGLSANSAIKKITSDNGNSDSLLSFLQNSNVNDLKGKSDGRTNILLLGMGGRSHPGGLLTDSMIVFSIDYKTNKVAMISIPRDLWVPVPGFGSGKINSAFADGETNKSTTGGGGALASKTVENILGIPIHYYVDLDFEGFKKLIDTIGGVDINVDKAIYDPYYPAADMIHYDPFSISTGQHHMDGALALKYARSRETTSDFDRSRRQQQVMAAAKEKMTTLGIMSNPKKITDIIGILGDHIRTNMQVSEIKSFWEISKDLDLTNVISKVLDTSSGSPLISSTSSAGAYIIVPKKGATNFIDLETIAKNIFDSTSGTSAADVGVQLLNGTKKSGLTTNLSKTLKAQGYDVISTGNSAKYYTTSIVYDCGNGKYASAAKDIATIIKATSQSKTSCSSSGVDIQVILGDDYVSTTK